MKPQPGTLEFRFFRLATERILNKLDFFDIVFLKATMVDEPDYAGIIRTLQSQQKDNPRGMQQAFGTEIAELLAILKPETL